MVYCQDESLKENAFPVRNSQHSHPQVLYFRTSYITPTVSQEGLSSTVLSSLYSLPEESWNLLYFSLIDAEIIGELWIKTGKRYAHLISDHMKSFG